MLRFTAALWLIVAFSVVASPATAEMRQYSPSSESQIQKRDSSTGASSFAGLSINPLTLEAAIILSINNNPLLSAARYRINSHRAVVRQAKLLPNPELSFDAENFGGEGQLEGGGLGEFTIGLSQLVELGGKRTKRTLVANAELELAISSGNIRKQDVLRSTSSRFYQILADQQRLTVSDSLFVIAQRFYDSVRERRVAGKVSALEERRANLQLTSARIQRATALQSLSSSWIDLRSLWGAYQDSSTVAVGELEDVMSAPPIDLMIQRLEQHPDIVSSRNNVALQRSNFVLEKAQAIPDPTISIGGRRIRELGATGPTASVSIPLSLFNRNQGSVKSADFEISVAEALLQAKQAELMAHLYYLHSEVDAARAQVLALGNQALVDAMENMNATVAGYKDGKFDLLTVLDAQRVLLNISTQHIDALERYHLSRIELESLISATFTTLISGEADNE